MRQDRERDAIKTERKREREIDREKEIENAEERRKMVPQRGTEACVCTRVCVPVCLFVKGDSYRTKEERKSIHYLLNC